MKARLITIAAYVLTLVMVWCSREHIFFWDTVQFAGKHGDWYYENGLLSGLLPPHLDSGHPPLFGIYIAGLWKLFGHNLTVAHFSMLPFLFVNLWFATKLGRLVLGERCWLLVIGLLLCPFYLGQSLLVSPDIILVTGFLVSMYGLLAKRRLAFIIGSLILAIISVRGMTILFLLGIYQLITTAKSWTDIPQSIVSTLPQYIPAILLFLAYQVWHYFHTEWIGFHDDSPWSPSFQTVSSLKDFLYNCGLYVWRLIDFGMLFIYIAIVYLWFRTRSKKDNSLTILMVLLIIGLGLITVPFTGLINHRYYLPIQIVTILWFLQLSLSISLPRVMIVLLLMAAGNCLIYPDRVAQGWDSTAAHFPYYTLEKQMHNFILNQSEIELSDVGTAFPLRVSRHYLDPSADEQGYHKYDMSTDKYILYSNVMNDFQDEHLDKLEEWRVEKSLQSFGVKMVLYSRLEQVQ